VKVDARFGCIVHLGNSWNGGSGEEEYKMQRLDRTHKNEKSIHSKAGNSGSIREAPPFNKSADICKHDSPSSKKKHRRSFGVMFWREDFPIIFLRVHWTEIPGETLSESRCLSYALFRSLLPAVRIIRLEF
jgi:hypothetical protein